MNERLPKLDFEGTYFYFDVKNEELRQVGNPSNRIRFADMEVDDDLCVFYYNARSKKQHKEEVKDEAHLPPHIRQVLIRREATLGHEKPYLVPIIPLVDSEKKFNQMQKLYLKNVRIKAAKKQKPKR